MERELAVRACALVAAALALSGETEMVTGLSTERGGTLRRSTRGS
jgi:hypothetical protein